MKKSLKMIGLVLHDVLFSKFSKTLGLFLGLLLAGWLLFPPTMMILELYERTPVLQLLFEGPMKTTEPRMIDTVQEDGTVIKGSYLDLYVESLEFWWLPPVIGGLIIILILIVLAPLILLFVCIFLLYCLYRGFVKLVCFLKSLPLTLHLYKNKLEDRLNERQNK
jgi:hypothetical protein